MTTYWQKGFRSLLSWILVLILALPPCAIAQEPGAETAEAETTKTFKKEELDHGLEMMSKLSAPVKRLIREHD